MEPHEGVMNRCDQKGKKKKKRKNGSMEANINLREKWSLQGTPAPVTVQPKE